MIDNYNNTYHYKLKDKTESLYRKLKKVSFSFKLFNLGIPNEKAKSKKQNRLSQTPKYSAP